ncbi:Benzoate-CoA ligase family protein [Devosia sp. LC5]|nr:Benzoate-CoA ligase family protein [Devosia sp. LC5]
MIISEHGYWGLTDLRVLVNADVLIRARDYRSVALRLTDPAKLALALLALDGFVERLLLLSADLADDLAASLSAQFGADAILTDLDGGLTPAVPNRLVWTGPTSAGPDQSPSPKTATEWTLTTSGTTGVPKLVTHTLASLSRTTKGAATAKYRWGQLYSMERFAGLQVFLQALLGGSLVLPGTEWPLPRRLSYLADHECTALSATPTLWRKILMTPASASLAPMQITLGGEIVDDAILGALAARFPASRIVHIYASTEAGVGFSVKDGREGFPVEYLADAPGGVQLKIVDGHLFIRNPAARTIAELDSASSDASFIDTGDAVAVIGERCYFLGRASGVINVGGNKLFPEEVEQVLLAHPAVKQARVWGIKSPITGQLVSAEIVPASQDYAIEELHKILHRYCTDRLEPWKMPAIIRVVDDLEVNAAGKVKRSPQ